MLSDRQRIEKQKATPALIRLHHALTRLRSVVTVMNTGAHPDDEQSGMLAYLRFHAGMRVIVACSTRGEGGQNALGPERGGALGLIRSREMEEAARILDCDIHWLGHGPEDTVHDFGFSKDGDRTFDRWGEERIVERLVRAYRSERPDIVIPTFLDVPGQHGHHRAMTRAAETAIALAADAKAFPEHFTEGLTVWQVGKYYLPAWSGGGDTYDDEVPPPETTLTLCATDREPVTGADYDRIGEWSRYYHASQGMGHWPQQPKTQWPLHLLHSASGIYDETSVTEHLPENIGALAVNTSLPVNIADALRAAQAALDSALAAFPQRNTIIRFLTQAALHIDAVRAGAPDTFLRDHQHRLQRKKREIDSALIEAAAIVDQVAVTPPVLSPAGDGVLKVTLNAYAAQYQTSLMPVLPRHVQASRQAGTPSEHCFDVVADAQAKYSALYKPRWSALGGNDDLHVQLSVWFDNYQAVVAFDPEEPFAVVPPQSVTIAPETIIVPLGEQPVADTKIDIQVSGDPAVVHFEAAGGWEVQQGAEGTVLCAPEQPQAGLFRLKPYIGERQASRLTPLSYPHIGRVIYHEAEFLNVLALDLTLPEGVRIGYIGGGADHTGLWLKRMGFDVTELEPQHLAADLSRFTTIVVGIFAFGTRKELAAATTKLHNFVQKGGNLLTLYHRSSDGWNPQSTPPRPLQIGSPSLRWRVTDAAAPVTVLEPDHILLNWPNKITTQDWEGWDKERGLYFASRWDAAYQPLLSMHDADEQPLTGALLSAQIGEGRHTHTSLVVHHQMDKLVAGAFRLMANLVSGKAV